MDERKKQLYWKIGCLAGVAVLIAADVMTKNLISQKLYYGEKIEVIAGFFNITYHTNFGAAWGILQGALPFFIIVSIAMAAAMSGILVVSRNKWLDVALTWLLGGAIGNFIERVRGEGVTDFLDFYIFGYDFPIFNVADICITTGTIILACYMLFFQKEKDISWKWLKKN